MHGFAEVPGGWLFACKTKHPVLCASLGPGPARCVGIIGNTQLGCPEYVADVAVRRGEAVTCAIQSPYSDFLQSPQGNIK